MFSLSNLPSRIPIFPLPNAVLLPNGQLPLNIFEPRYLAMINDALKSEHRLIGMVQPRADNTEEKLHTIGCAGRITSFKETKDNRYLITLTGVCRYQLDDVKDSFLPYLTANVDWDRFSQDLKPTQSGNPFDRSKFLKLLQTYFQEMDLTTDWDELKSADETMLINSLAMLCPFTAQEKQALLEAHDLKERSETIITIMEFSLRDKQADRNKIQ